MKERKEGRKEGRKKNKITTTTKQGLCTDLSIKIMGFSDGGWWVHWWEWGVGGCFGGERLGHTEKD